MAPGPCHFDRVLMHLFCHNFAPAAAVVMRPFKAISHALSICCIVTPKLAAANKRRKAAVGYQRRMDNVALILATGQPGNVTRLMRNHISPCHSLQDYVKPKYDR